LFSPRKTRRNKTVPQEYVEFALCKMFHKLPHEFDKMPESMLQLWQDFISAESESEEIEIKRREQKNL